MGGTSFTIQWPSSARPAEITTPFSSETKSLSIAASAGTKIKAGAVGRVISVTDSQVQIETDQFVITYGNLTGITVQVGEQVSVDVNIGLAVGTDGITIMVYQVIDPTPLLAQPTEPVKTDDTAPPRETDDETSTTPQTSGKLWVASTADAVRIRQKAVNGAIVGQVDKGDILEVIEPTDDARPKIGKNGEWLQIRTLYGVEGYSAGQFYELYTGDEPTSIPSLSGLTGMNLDMNNPLGRPSPDRMQGIGWIRVKFNVSFNPDNGTHGNTDVNATFNRMKPFLEPYVRAGIKVLIVFTHQLYGEGAGYNWPTMNTDRWNDLIPKYADFAKQAAALLSGAGLVHAYQIWNEQDTDPAVARAAVPIPPADYGNMLTQTIRAIRLVDKTTPIITGGHCTGPDSGGKYARATLAAMPAGVRPDGIATHPYGRGVKGSPFSKFGSLDEELRKYSAVLPGKPVWITEWGVLDRQNDNSISTQTADYATGFMGIIKRDFPGKVAAAVWYAWADGMDNGYGLVDKNDKPKKDLYDRFLKL